jgi:hypothetical protein
MQLDGLLAISCDVELRLDDGTMPASSVALRMISGVLSNALDAEIGCLPSTRAEEDRPSCRCIAANPTILPLPGITKTQWRRVAEFVYPVAPAPQIRNWGEAGYLLAVSAVFQLLFQQHVP